MSDRVHLGSWDCPSTNNVIAHLRMVSDGFAMIEMEWDDPPPLRPEDEAYYLAVIQPAVARLVGEYTEKTGRTLVIGT